MSDSVQLDILKRLTAHLQGITVANGWDFDLADRIFRGRRFYGDSDPVPMISIIEHLQPDIDLSVAGENKISRTETWLLLVQGWVQDDVNNPTDPAYQLKANVELRLSQLIATNSYGDPAFPDVYLLGRTLTGLSIGPGVVSPPVEQVSSKAFFYLPLGVGLAIDISRPFVS